MNANIHIIKGIHPGLILERELKIRKLPKGAFALSINEFPQTIATITKGKRRMNPALSLKIILYCLFTSTSTISRLKVFVPKSIIANLIF